MHLATDTWFDHITELPAGLSPKEESDFPRPPDHTLETNVFNETVYSDGTHVETYVMIPLKDYPTLQKLGGYPESTCLTRIIGAAGRCKLLREHYAKTTRYKVLWSGTPEEFLEATSDETDNDGEEWKTS